MANDSFDEPTDMTQAERADFDALPRLAAPSPVLEERVVAALKQRGILRRHSPSVLRFGVPIGAVAAAGLFGAGLVAGRSASVPPPRDPRPEFVLFLQEGKHFDSSAAASDAHVGEYKGWAQALGKRGLLVSGEKLKEEGVFLEGDGVEIVVGGETVLGSDAAPRGYFVIRARDVDEALSIARGCPHLKHGGRISLRPIERV